MTARRALLVPEVIQSSAMDCGPAALKSLLAGFGIPVSYGRLREACQTDVDGSSIDVLEELAKQLGLDAEQVLLPVDHLPLPESGVVPALMVLRQPQGDTHFVVVWRTHASWVQIMDPAVGRRWLTWESLLGEVYVHTAQIPAETVREWAGGAGFLSVLRARLRRLHISPDSLIESALSDPGPARILHLDAAVRMVTELVESSAIKRGAAAERLVEALYAGAQQGTADGAIPASYYTARPAAPSTPGEAPQLAVRGAILLRVMGRTQPAATSPEPEPEPEKRSPEPASKATERFLESSAAQQPLRSLWQMLGPAGTRALWLLPLLALLCAAGSVLEALLFRGLLESSSRLRLPLQRAQIGGILSLFCVLILCCDLALQSYALRLGRWLELRLRLSLLGKITRLEDRYFQSRPLSDMADRSHQLHRVRELPVLAALLLRALGQALLTAAALIWLDPHSTGLVALLVVATLGVPLLLLPILLERDLRARSHQGALARFHLDTLLGRLPLRAHGGEGSIRSEHESLLSEWGRARRRLGQSVLLLTGGQGLLGLCSVAALWLGYLGRHREPSGVLLLAYWSLSLPALGQTVALCLRQYPALRSSLLRILEPLQTPDVPNPAAAALPGPAPDAPAHSVEKAPRGVEIQLAAVSVLVAGHPLLRTVSLHIPPGCHVAVVGASGAGKSSLFGVLLGFHQPAEGSVQIDDALLTEATLDRLREQTAWVDPAVQIFDRSLLDNLRFGASAETAPIDSVLADAELFGVLSRLPDGLQTRLGEAGALVSGGEGQRVRLGRALLRTPTRLVVLDEPFRGLTRATRHALLQRTRAHYREATLLCATHDVAETLEFDRVIVLEDGAVVEDDSPQALRQRPDSRYSVLLAAEQKAQAQVWGDPAWRRLELCEGRLTERAAAPSAGEKIDGSDEPDRGASGPRADQRDPHAGR